MNERNQEIIRLYLGDDRLTMIELAERYQITRERVRQIIGVNSRGYSVSRATIERRDVRKHFEREHTEEVLDRFREIGSADVVANEYPDVPRSWIDSILTNNLGKEKNIYSRKAIPSVPKERLLDYLREAHAALEVDTPMSHEAYTRIARENGWPGAQTMMLRFGTWRAAQHEAGIPAQRFRGGPQPWFDEEDCTAALVQFMQEEDAPWTAAAYDRWQRTVDDAPSMATVRKRLGGTWTEARLRAYGAM